MGDLDGDGRGAILNTRATSTRTDRQRARRKAADLALAEPDPHQALRQLLDLLDLNPTQGEPP
jgi:hypothetical protein